MTIARLVTVSNNSSHHNPEEKKLQEFYAKLEERGCRIVSYSHFMPSDSTNVPEGMQHTGYQAGRSVQLVFVQSKSRIEGRQLEAIIRNARKSLPSTYSVEWKSPPNFYQTK